MRLRLGLLLLTGVSTASILPGTQETLGEHL